ncbi:hypothetical protein MMC22_004510 [Lobaria immixta]|nr:hypothetical protein [Lobaria immixta]
MANKRQPEENRPRERLHRPGYQEGHQRDPIRRAPQLAPRPQSPIHEHNLNHRNVHDQAFDFPARDIPYRPQPMNHGHRRGHRHVHEQNPGNETPELPARPQQPYSLQLDHRLPAAGTYPSSPIYLSSPDGFATQLLLLLPPSSPVLSAVLADAKKARIPNSHIPAEDVVERALENRTLMHVSDGPTGGIWVVAAEKPEVVACLVAEMQGGWEILGVGKGGNDGMTFLRHPCGFGPEIEEDDEDEEEEKRVKRAKAEENEQNRERDRDEERAWESEEDTDEEIADVWNDPMWERVQDVDRGRARERVPDVDRGRARERVHNVDRGRDREGDRAVERGRERELGWDRLDRMLEQDRLDRMLDWDRLNRMLDRTREAERNRQRSPDQDEQMLRANFYRDYEGRNRRP